MRNLFLLLFALLTIVSACTQQQEIENFVFVKGGTFMNKKSNLYGKGATIADFYMGKYEITQKEWTRVMENNPSQFKGDNLPVENVSWYDCLAYCNKRSLKEGLTPYYNIDYSKKDTSNKAEMDSIKWTITINPGANGYRLPTEAEWEYAAGGGQMSKSCKYSGSNKVEDVAWYWQNSGDSFLTGAWSAPALENNHCKTKPVGTKKPNELGIYDMSGNVREWCEDWYEDFNVTSGQGRVWRGGGWMGADFCCESSFRASHEPNGKGPDQGFRVCRGK